MPGLKYWVWLSLAKGISSRKTALLLQQMSSPEQVYFADKETYLRSGLNEKEADALGNKSLSEAARVMEQCDEKEIHILTMADAAYPERLANIYDPPCLLYVRGNLPVIDEEAAIAAAGTRKCSAYGLRIAEKIGYDLAKEGCLLLSGLAKGIDAASAKGALRAGGMVVGVIGCGPDIIYPAENRNLYEDVVACGAIVSEYPPGAEPSAWHFPARNRILSGLSSGVLIIEAPEKSGALITAARALEQGRDVFAVPANADSPAARGSNRLIRAGAIPVLCGKDVADEYRAMFPRKLTGLVQKQDGKKQVDKKKSDDYDKISHSADSVPALSGDEAIIWNILEESCLQVNDIIEKSALPGARVLAALTMMEIRGIVRQEAGKQFRRQNV